MLEQQIKEIVGEVSKTKEFKELIQAKAVLEKNAALKKTVEEFFMESDQKKTREQKAELDAKYKQMLKVPEIAGYFTAGRNFDMVVIRLHHLLDELIEQQLE
jgi:hypothetical protein